MKTNKNNSLPDCLNEALSLSLNRSVLPKVEATRIDLTSLLYSATCPVTLIVRPATTPKAECITQMTGKVHIFQRRKNDSISIPSLFTISCWANF